MPSYYNPYTNAYPMNYGGSAYGMNQPVIQQMPTQYMINVDGEAAARAWQSPIPPQPNTIVPLFDMDGQHVYFKSFDAYGRMNPLRVGRIVFDDEKQPSGYVQTQPADYALSGDLKKLEEEVESLKQSIQNSRNQPMQNNQNGTNNRGDKR